MGDLILAFKDLKSQWKLLIVSIVTTSSFWYMCFFLFKKTIILELNFYIPMILSITISIVWYSFSYAFAFAVAKIVNIDGFGEDKKEIDGVMIFGLITSLFLLSLFIGINLFLHLSLTYFTIFGFIILDLLGTSAFVIVIIIENKEKSKT